MLFTISRVSNWETDVQPIEGSVLREVTAMDRGYWTLEVNSLEELLELIKKVDNPIIVSEPNRNRPGIPHLSIYDDLLD